MQIAAPVSLNNFAARLDALNAGPRFAVAVSGGRDSMALARLCADYAHEKGADVVALIVDHGLRPESAFEAARAKNWCDAAGLPAKILKWEGEKPAFGVQAAARNARYRLLAEAANAANMPAIFTAHTSDDQAETVAMRLARGAGPAGLAGMREEIMIAAGAGKPVRLLRPLLSFSRTQMTETARRYNQEWIDDPSNDDTQYERVRVRRSLGSGNPPLGKEALLALASQMRDAADRIDAADRSAFDAVGSCFTRWGGASLDLKNPDAISASLIARLIRAVSGADYAPDEAAASDAFQTALTTGAATLGGALLKKAEQKLWIVREPAALLGRAGVAPMAPVSIAPAERVLWDHRFVIETTAPVSVRPLGTDAAAKLGPAATLFDGPREGLFSLPGLYQRERLIGVPGILFRGGVGWSAAPLARERFNGGIVRFL